jgi:superfamily I DNA and/or RNA helicase
VSRRPEEARSELFLSALRLHEATLMANADAWFTLLRVVRGFLGGQSQPKTQQDREAIWHALFFVVPVVSTTLASFGRLFEGMGQESLGWVLVDEAGQAPAASVAGALWRARRAVMVGDPLQIEPIVTVPRALAEKLGGQRGMDSATIAHWSPCVQSAQTIADRTMRLGAMVGDVWTGLPLRTHRRCMEPMFAVANRIAYDDQMVQATRPLNVEPDFHASCWIDVQGTGNGKLVQAEIDVLQRILETFLDGWPNIIAGNGEPKPASVYIISPFRDVAQACKDLVDGDATLGRQFSRRKLVVDAGTVHTFQGKEASIVFMVLGSAPGAAGAGSRSWAAGKPNLLNVALTRAQQRFYVIGNHTDWSGLPYFSELSEQAGRMPRMRLETVEGARQVRLVPASQTMPGSCIV